MIICILIRQRLTFEVLESEGTEESVSETRERDLIGINETHIESVVADDAAFEGGQDDTSGALNGVLSIDSDVDLAILLSLPLLLVLSENIRDNLLGQLNVIRADTNDNFGLLKSDDSLEDQFRHQCRVSLSLSQSRKTRTGSSKNVLNLLLLGAQLLQTSLVLSSRLVAIIINRQRAVDEAE